MALKKDKKAILDEANHKTAMEQFAEETYHQEVEAYDDVSVQESVEEDVSIEETAAEVSPTEEPQVQTQVEEPLFPEFENNSLEDPELTISAFDRGTSDKGKRIYDPRIKPKGMPRHKEKAWRDLPLGGKIYEIVYYLCLVVFCVSLGVLGARGYAYMTHKQQANDIKDLYAGREPISSTATATPGPDDTSGYPQLTVPPPIDHRPDDPDGTADVTTDITADLTTDANPEDTTGVFIPTPPPVSTPVPQVRPSFANLVSINRDVVGWIQLTGTVINYPVMQSHDPNNKSFYLDHDIFGKATYYGSIFMEYACSAAPLGKNTVVSGHHMQDGEMFRQIANYTSAYMWREHPVIFFDTVYENYEWEIFACFLANADNEALPITFSSTQSFIDYCNRCKERSVVKYGKDVQFGPDDKILTLVTCSYNGKYADERTIAVFRLVERSGELDSDTKAWKPTTPRVSSSWK